jgi:hypothetical protein
MPNAMQQAFTSTLITVVNNTVVIVPRFFGSLIIIIVGFAISQFIKSSVIHFLKALRLSRLVKDSPLERYAPKPEVSTKIEELVGEIIKWAINLVFLIAAFNVLGLYSVAQVLSNLISYVPQFISALLILILGIVAAGLVEGVVKNAISAYDPASGRLMGKLASYTVVVLTGLAAISELGIAEFFIKVLFVGFVAMVSLGVGLSFGLGGKEVVAQGLRQIYRHRVDTDQETHPPKKSSK